MTTQESEIRAVAARAVEVLRERGWHQGDFAADADYENTTCPVCLMGAISVATGRNPFDSWSPTMDETVGQVRRLADTGGVGKWNDDRNRTVDEVISVLQRVAAGEGAP